jgi:hypothetical protein
MAAHDIMLVDMGIQGLVGRAELEEAWGVRIPDAHCRSAAKIAYYVAVREGWYAQVA